MKKLLKNLRTQKSCGPDGVHPYILHHLADTMSIPLTIIFKLSLQTRKVPSIWKQGVVSALFKKGKKCLASNYRAITLTSIVCKILEKIIVTSIQKHLKINLLEDLHQHGFTINKSTITNLLEALNIWSEALSPGVPKPSAPLRAYLWSGSSFLRPFWVCGPVPEAGSENRVPKPSAGPPTKVWAPTPVTGTYGNNRNF